MILQAFPGKIVNIHPALLPKYGGKGMYGMHVHEAVVKAEMCIRDRDRVESIPLLEVAGKLKLVTPDHDLIVQGKRMGVTFGK